MGVVHLAYADSADGSVNFNFDSGDYLGQYTDNTQADSGDYSIYTWVKIKGDTGATGLPGTIVTVSDPGGALHTVTGANGVISIFDGDHGDYLSMVYCQVANGAARPNIDSGSGSYTGTAEVFPTGNLWVGDPAYTAGQTTYVSQNYYTHDAATDTWALKENSWSVPSKFLISPEAAPQTQITAYAFLRSSTPLTIAPTGGSYNSPEPDGWSDGIPVGIAPIYIVTGIFTSDGLPPQNQGTPFTWTVPRLLSENGTGFRHLFGATSLGPWHEIPLTTDEWMIASRQLPDGTWIDDTANPIRIKGEVGVTPQAQLNTFAYKRTDLLNFQETPLGGSYVSPFPVNGAVVGWTSKIPAGSESLYVSTRVFTTDGLPPQDDSWSPSVLFSGTSDARPFTVNKYHRSDIEPTQNPDEDPDIWGDSPPDGTESLWWAFANFEADGTMIGEWTIVQVEGTSAFARELSARLDELDGLGGVSDIIDDILIRSGEHAVDMTGNWRIAQENVYITEQEIVKSLALAIRVDDTSAALLLEQIVRADGDTAEATQRLQLAAEIATDITAAVQVETTARVAADSAEASARTTLATTVGANTAAASVNLTSIDGVQAKFTVKVDVNGYISGFGLISTANDGVPTSEFTVLADKFLVVTPGKSPQTVFQINSLDGKVYMDTAIVDKIQSINFASGFTGWQIDSLNDSAEFGSITVYDGAGGVVLNASGELDGAYIKSLTVGTLQIIDGSVFSTAITKLGSISSTSGLQAGTGWILSPSEASGTVVLSFANAQSNTSVAVNIKGSFKVETQTGANIIYPVLFRKTGAGSYTFIGFGKAWDGVLDTYQDTDLWYADAPGPGTHTYAFGVYWNSAGGATVQFRSQDMNIMVMGGKK